MEPTTRTTPHEHTTWKHWATALALPTFITIGAPAIASLPLDAAYPIAGVLVGTLTLITLALARAQR